MCEPLLYATLLEDPVWAKPSQSMTMGSLQSREETEDCHCWRGKVVSLWIVMVLGRWRVKGKHRQEVHRVLKSNALHKTYIEGTTCSRWHSSLWVPTWQDFMTAVGRMNTRRARVWGLGGHWPSQRKPCTLHVLHVTPGLHLLLLLPSFSSMTPQAAWSPWSRSHDRPLCCGYACVLSCLGRRRGEAVLHLNFLVTKTWGKLELSFSPPVASTSSPCNTTAD